MVTLKYIIPRTMDQSERSDLCKRIREKVGEPVDYYLDLTVHDFNGVAVTIHEEPVGEDFAGGTIIGVEHTYVRNTVRALDLEKYVVEVKA